MKKKQIFFLESGDGVVYLRTHLKRYLSVDDNGKFLANAEGKGANEGFTIEAQPDGRWALKSAKNGWYAGGAGEDLSAFTSEIAPDRLWTVHLAMHPHVAIRNVKRGRYVRLTPEHTCATDQNIPWGHEASMFIEFDHPKGQYRLRASDGSYLASDGTLSPEPTEQCSYILEFAGGLVSFKSAAGAGHYMTALGRQGLVKCAKKAVSKDEQWVLEDSWAQASLRSRGNGKFVSITQGVEASCTAAECRDNEVFQFEPSTAGKWIIKTCKERLWQTLETGAINTSAGLAAANAAPASCLFGIDFRADHVVLTASNGHVVSQKMNGYLSAAAGVDGSDKLAQFAFEIVNRPKLVLRGAYGFVGTLPSGLLECNKSAPEAYELRYKDGKVSIATANGKFWKVHEDSVSASGTTEHWFSLALHKESKLTISTESGGLFHGAQNGALTAKGDRVQDGTLWEY